MEIERSSQISGAFTVETRLSQVDERAGRVRDGLDYVAHGGQTGGQNKVNEELRMLGA